MVSHIAESSLFSLEFNSNASKGLPLLIIGVPFTPRPQEADLREDLFLRRAEIWRETIFGITAAYRGFAPFVVTKFGVQDLEVGSNNHPA